MGEKNFEKTTIRVHPVPEDYTHEEPVFAHTLWVISRCFPGM